jgi:hypothetical protein
MPWFVIVQSITKQPEELTVWTRFPVGDGRYSYLGAVSNTDFTALKKKYKVVEDAKWLKKFINPFISLD